MAPTTRRSAKATSSQRTLDEDSPPSIGADSDAELRGQQSGTLQSLLKRSLRGAQDLERDNHVLRRKVDALEAKLERLRSADVSVTPRRSKRAAMAASELQNQVKVLQDKVRRLEKSKMKYRKSLHESRMREMKSEADELADGAEFEVGDSGYKMRKLLREFHDWMIVSSLEEENEECSVCLESKLKPHVCQSFPCQHLFCNDCIKQFKPINDDPDVEHIQCPQCRTVCARDQLEVVEFTASAVWDGLLDVAKRWAKIDLSQRREEDTTEEEGEEEFIVDGENGDESEESNTASEHVLIPPNPLESSPEPEAQERKEHSTPSRSRGQNYTSPLSSPEPADIPRDQIVPSDTDTRQEAEQSRTPQAGPSSAGPSSYTQSPTRDKRKVLEELVAARVKRRKL